MKELKQFRAAMHAAGSRSEVPSLNEILERARPRPVLHLRWAAAAMMLLTVSAVPVYRDARERRLAAEQQAEALLMETVDAALERSVPRALAPLLAPIE